MTAMLFFGCAFVAFGTGVALFIMLISRKAQLIIVTISAAFFWLLALMIASLFWYIIPPLQSTYGFYVPVGVMIQEIVRLVFFRFYEKGERSFSGMSTNAVTFPLDDLSSATAAGLGFGFMQTLMFYGSIIGSAWGSGTLFSPWCSAMSVFVLSAWMAFCFLLLHVFLMIIAFDAYRRNSPHRALGVLCIHMLAALTTLFNRMDNGCEVSLPLEFVITIATGALMAFVIHRPGYRSKLAVS